MSSAYDFRTDRLKILSSCCKGRALPMLRASNLPSSCRQSTAMAQITYLNNVVLKNILRENLKKEPKETRDGGGMLALPQSQCWFPWTMSFYSTSFITKACLTYDLYKTDGKLSETVWSSPIHVTGVIFQQTPPHINVVTYSTVAWNSTFRFHKTTW